MNSNNKQFQQVTLSAEADLLNKKQELKLALENYSSCLSTKEDCHAVKRVYNNVVIEVSKSIRSGVISKLKNSISEIKESIDKEKFKVFGYPGEVNLGDILDDNFELTEDASLFLEFELDIKILDQLIDQESRNLKKIEKYIYIANVKGDLNSIRKLIKSISNTNNFDLKVNKKAILHRIKNSDLGHKIKSRYKSFGEKTL